MNSCGPKIVKWMSWIEKICVWILNKILDILSPHFFQASCERHDEWYQEWWDEKRRRVCDLKFHQAICDDIRELRVVFIKKIWYYILSFIFYWSVRKLGWRYFNYIEVRK